MMENKNKVYAFGYKISGEQLKNICSLYGLTPVDTNSPSDLPDDTVVFFDKINDSDLADMYNLRAWYFFDINVSDFKKLSADLPSSSFKRIVISTLNANNLNFGHFYAENIGKILNLDGNKKYNARVAIHEAISNAILHGNLEIPNDLRNSLASLKEFGDTLKQRLNDKSYARRAITITLIPSSEGIGLRILDEGQGFPENIGNLDLSSLKQADKKFNRGIETIAKLADNLAFDKNGREITLTFFNNNIKEKITDNNILKEDKEKGKPISPLTTNYAACKVLIIEDDMKTQSLISKLLSIVGIDKVFFSNNGEEGLSKAHAITPDLIILNINLPTMKGDEVLASLKSSPALSDIPVLVETSYESQEIKDKIFKMGASDYLTKPFSLSQFFSRIRIILENRMLIKTLEADLKRIELDLKSAKSIQSCIMPSQSMLDEIKAKLGISINNFFMPSPKLSGDFWGVEIVSHNKLALYCCSFSGYGVTAVLNTFRLSLLLKDNPIIYPFKPSSYVTNLNKVLSTLLQKDQYSTFLYGIFDLSDESFTYCMAGASAPIIINEKDGIVIQEEQGTPLALDVKSVYTDIKINFKRGTSIMVFSNSLPKTPYKDSKEIGTNGLKEIIKKHNTKIASTDDFFNNIICDFFSNIPNSENLSEDLTLLQFSR